MKYVQVTMVAEGISKKDLWEFLTDIESYPKHVPFLLKAHTFEPLAKGSRWFDITRILWIPMKFQHKTLSLTEEKEMSFQVVIPFHGYMQQSYYFEQKEENANRLVVIGEAKFHLKNPIIHAFVGPILHKRLEKMIIGTFENISKKVSHAQVITTHISKV